MLSRTLTLSSALASVVLLAACNSSPTAETTPAPPPSSPTTATTPPSPPGSPTPTAGASGPAGATSAVVAAARAFLAGLSAEQRERAVYDVADPAVRDWSNLPVSSSGRSGVGFSDLSAPQRTAALGMAEAVLSADGYAELRGIIAAGDALNARSGGNSSFSSDRYFFAVFGEPHPTRRFTVQIGGHHLAVTTTYENGNVRPTPAFTGVDPRFFEVDGQRVEPLRDEADAVFALLGSLDAGSRDRARIGGSYDDVLVGAGDDGQFPPAEGVLISELNAEQRERVTTLVRAWVGDTDERAARVLLTAYQAQYGETRIAWAGSTEPDAEGAYLRIDGPRLWIEFSNQSQTGGGGDEIHYHSIYRDKMFDYGG